MTCQWLKRIPRLGIVVGEEQVSDLVVQSIVYTSFAFESIPFAQGSRLQ